MIETDDDNSTSEKEHFFKIICAFKSYRCFSRSIITKRISFLDSLPSKQQAAMEKYRRKLNDVLVCIDLNQRIIRMIIDDVEKLFENLHHEKRPNGTPTPQLKVSDVDKVQITLKQIYREWSSSGAEERAQAYVPILEEIESRFPANSQTPRHNVSILVPGAGLGRLAFEISRLGFTCQGNEFSLFMLFTSNFILNRCSGTNLFEVYPWTQSCDNNFSPNDMTTSIKFPDVDPSELQKRNETPNRFTMVAGDFLEVYNKDCEWDCIATCFFIDCANNIYDFIEKIYKLLKPGGVWINLGPLQYHFSTSLNENSIEPSYSVVKDVITSVGFNLEKENSRRTTFYCQNPASMCKQYFESVFFVCTKPSTVSP